MREMDLVFQDFIENHYLNVSSELQKVFEQLQDETDLDIYDWIMGRAPLPKQEYRPILDIMLTLHPFPDSN